MVWQELQYPQREFQPQADPSEYVFESYLAAAAANSHLSQPGFQPVYPIEYRYWLPYVFVQIEPSEQANPVYYEAWQNQSTWVMPLPAILYVYMLPATFMQIGPPVYLPDGTGVASPTSTEPITPSRTTTEPV